FFREAGVAVADRTFDAVLPGAPGLGCRECGKRLGYRRDQHPPALIQRLDREIAPPRRQHQRRVDKPHIKPGIAPRKLEARRQQDAAAVVEGAGERVMLTLIGPDPGLALDANAAPGRIAGALHRDPLSVSAASEGSAEPQPEMA